MGFQFRRTTTCERAARSISLRLDGELSELEGAALDRHLGECARCRELAVETDAFTRLLREAPLVEYDRELAFTPAHRVRRRVVRRGAFALAAVGGSLAALLGALSGTSLTGSPETHASSALAFRDLAEQRRFVKSELIRLEPHTQFVVDEAPPRLVGRGLL
jgi:predicted anti-sigma-YlaC factor YlaD